MPQNLWQRPPEWESRLALQVKTVPRYWRQWLSQRPGYGYYSSVAEVVVLSHLTLRILLGEVLVELPPPQVLGKFRQSDGVTRILLKRAEHIAHIAEFGLCYSP